MQFLAIAAAALGLASSSASLPTAQGVEGTVGGKSLNVIKARQFGVQRAWLWVDDCSGRADYTWNGGSSCYSFVEGDVAKDMYSVYVGGSCVVKLFHDNFDCSGVATKTAREGTNECHHLDGNSIKSFDISC